MCASVMFSVRAHCCPHASSSHLQFETSSVTHDIPYSDVFTVETKWNVWTEETEEGRPPCTWVHLHWEVHFFDSVWLKGAVS